MTGIIAAFLTGTGIALVAFGTIAGLALADAPAAVAVAAGFTVPGLLGAWLYLRDRWRGARFPSLTELRYRAAALRGENRAARPRWTEEDREWLEANRAVLPGGRRRWP